MLTKQQKLVTTYRNPDTDGVACALAYCELRRLLDGTKFDAVFFGIYGPETIFVASELGIKLPLPQLELPRAHPTVLVDMHHLPQLPPGVNPELVEEIIDHHPEGTPEAFPNARIQNENVGAAASLVAERFRAARITPSPGIAGLLSAAIVSNTLDFTAPSTSDRDRRALQWLQSIHQLRADFADRMFAARSDLGDTTTTDILLWDLKPFEIADLRIGISQLEVTDLRPFLSRLDLEAAADSVRRGRGFHHYFFSGVDLRARRTFLLAT